MAHNDSFSTSRLRIARGNNSGLARKLFPLLWVSYGLLSVLFGFTNGLALDCGGDIGPVGKVCHTDQLMDTAANDDLVILVGVVFGAIGAVWGLFRIRLAFGVTDWIVYAILLLLQAIFLGLTDEGSVSYTIAADHNAVLSLWVLAYSMLWVMVMMGAVAVLLRQRQPVQSEPNPGPDD